MASHDASSRHAVPCNRGQFSGDVVDQVLVPPMANHRWYDTLKEGRGVLNHLGRKIVRPMHLVTGLLLLVCFSWP